jgi:hypothetical protein
MPTVLAPERGSPTNWGSHSIESSASVLKSGLEEMSPTTWSGLPRGGVGPVLPSVTSERTLRVSAGTKVGQWHAIEFIPLASVAWARAQLISAPGPETDYPAVSVGTLSAGLAAVYKDRISTSFQFSITPWHADDLETSASAAIAVTWALWRSR